MDSGLDDLGLLLERTRRRRRLRSGSLASGCFIIIAIPLAICGLALPWWVGSHATAVVEESAGVDGAVGLWTFEATTSVIDIQLGATVRQTYESSWDTICGEDKVAGIKCHGIRLIRFLVFAEIGTLAAAFLAAVAACGCLVGWPSLLFLLTAALVSLAAAGTAAVALFIVMTISVDGLQGVGAACHLAGLAMGLMACSVAVYAASKAGQEPQKAPQSDKKKKRQGGSSGTRMQRFEKARLEAEAVRERLEAFHLGYSHGPRPGHGHGQGQGHGHSPAKTMERTRSDLMMTASRRSSVTSASGFTGTGKRKLPALETIISLAEQKGVEFDFPIPLLEAAFMEIDEDGSGRINASELGVCLRACKLKASDQAVRMVMDDMDSDRSGDVDIFEFVAFFHMLQDANRRSKKMEAKNELSLWGCRGCLVLHIMGLSMLLIMLIQMQGDDAKVRERAMLGDTVRLLFVSFVVLFAGLVLIPLVRLTLGPNIEAWTLEFKKALPWRPAWCPGFCCSCWHARPEPEAEAPPTIQLHEVRVQPKAPENRLSITAEDLEQALGEEGHGKDINNDDDDENENDTDMNVESRVESRGSIGRGSVSRGSVSRGSVGRDSVGRGSMGGRGSLRDSVVGDGHGDAPEAEAEGEPVGSSNSAGDMGHRSSLQSENSKRNTRLMLPLSRPRRVSISDQVEVEGAVYSSGLLSPKSPQSPKSHSSQNSARSGLSDGEGMAKHNRRLQLEDATSDAGGQPRVKLTLPEGRGSALVPEGRGSLLSSPLSVGRLGSMASDTTRVSTTPKSRDSVHRSRRSSMASMTSWIMPWRRRQSVVPELDAYDPSAFREAALAAQQAPPPQSFSLMHVVDSTIPSWQFCQTGCQPQRG